MHQAVPHGTPLLTHTLPEPPCPSHAQTHLRRALAAVRLCSLPSPFFSLEVKTQEVQIAALVGPRETESLCSDLQHFPLRAERYLGSSQRKGESQPSPVGAEFIAQMEATQWPPALLEPLLSHAPKQPGAGLGFASVSQDKRNQKLHLKLKALLQVTKLPISACPQSLEKTCHYSDLLQLGR